MAAFPFCRHRAWGAALAGLLACATAGGADIAALGGARFDVPVASIREARFARTLHQQYDFSCGSAAVATLLTHHYDDHVTERFVFEQMYQHGDQQKIRREGFSLLDIKRFLAARGFLANGFQLPLEKLAEAHFPAIVLVADKGYRHFVVVKGLSPSRVLIGDPAGGTRAMPRASFDAIWQGRLLFVIHGRVARPGQNLAAGADLRPARFNDADDWRVAPAAPLEQAISRGGLDLLTMPKHEAGNF
ncbi:C39 family peptidase [Janthinobacterium sp. PC23-8]|uniref:C39 family peptidase n=1 Tax=Janthinobacterium sp. PC23-8 TaxID=2012679 RepID=UPI000B972048|nr:C39 family peptidase [Janthinobacterium sp. PC23-8]OYO27821.1 peptidase C39 [Janthinobacterium sp. PC23-8]